MSDKKKEVSKKKKVTINVRGDRLLIKTITKFPKSALVGVAQAPATIERRIHSLGDEVETHSKNDIVRFPIGEKVLLRAHTIEQEVGTSSSMTDDKTGKVVESLIMVNSTDIAAIVSEEFTEIAPKAKIKVNQ